MAGPFIDRLKTYFSKVGEVLRGQADVASIFPNTTDIGISRERIYAEVLRQHLPKSSTVSFGGFLFDMNGNESKQIDLIVLNDISPQFNFHNSSGQGKAFACIDGCVAIASIKSTLDSKQLNDALDNIASLPNKMPSEGRHNPRLVLKNYNDLPYKIIYASDGVSSDTAFNTLNSFYNERREIPSYKRPNMIHVCGKYCIVRTGQGDYVSDGQSKRTLEENSFWIIPDASDTYSLLRTILEIQLRLDTSRQLSYNYLELINKIL